MALALMLYIGSQLSRSRIEELPFSQLLLK
jgi:hypothetical protein